MEFILRLYEKYQKWGLDISLDKTEYILANGETSFVIFINSHTYVNKLKNLEASLGTDIVGSFNSLQWDMSLSSKQKRANNDEKRIWILKDVEKRKLIAVEMNNLRRSVRVMRLQQIINEEIKYLLDTS